MTMTIGASNISEALAKKISKTRYEHLSSDAVTIARQCILDWIAVTLRAVDEPLVRMLAEQVNSEGGGAQASLVGRGDFVSVRQAALVNGAASHALDYDDVNMRMSGHPTVAILPAALALAESLHASGEDLIAAFVAGYDTACAIGEMVDPSHYARGFHVTGTVGTFGAAAACARLLGLNVEQTQAALGIAATQAAGLKAMFGTMCKPLHAGKASENGLLAAQLAARGFTSRPDAIECQQGFAATHSDVSLCAFEEAEAQGRCNLSENLFKYHASCYLTHSAIEAVRALRQKHGIGPDAVKRIVVRQDVSADTVCNIQRPISGLETKFSLRMLMAYVMFGVDTADSNSFTDERASESSLVAFRDRVEVTFERGWPTTLCEVRIYLNDGRELFAAHDSGTPESFLSRQTERLVDKFHLLVDSQIGNARARQLIGTVLSLEKLPDVALLTTQLRPA